jgi:hypothetical protein
MKLAIAIKKKRRKPTLVLTQAAQRSARQRLGDHVKRAW